MENDIGIIILAGGKSSRMGKDKGLLLINKQPIIQYIINSCLSISDHILIVSDNMAYGEFGYPIVKDKVKNIGPMGGLYSGLLASEKDVNLVLSCDVPLVSSQLLSELLTAKTDQNNVVVSKYQDRVHPLIGIYTKQIIRNIEFLIKRNRYKMSEIYSENDSLVLDVSHFPSKEFLNLNTVKEVEIFKQFLNDD